MLWLSVALPLLGVSATSLLCVQHRFEHPGHRIEGEASAERNRGIENPWLNSPRSYVELRSTRRVGALTMNPPDREVVVRPPLVD